MKKKNKKITFNKWSIKTGCVIKLLFKQETNLLQSKQPLAIRCSLEQNIISNLFSCRKNFFKFSKVA